MFPHLGVEPLSVIASAVTPAVMISASALLIGGISSKHSSMSDRLRSLTAEYRHHGTTEDRRKIIEKQCRLMMRRLRLIATAHLLLYISAAFFVFMVLSISLAPVIIGWQRALFPLFVSGVAMLLAGVMFEIVELQIADRTLKLELNSTFNGQA